MTPVPPDHPRAESLRVRELLMEAFEEGIVAEAGLIAQGRGEAFDYLLGEKTTNPALRAIEASAALLLGAEHPVISVNGNSAALAAKDIVRLSEVTDSHIEVNLFYRSSDREENISKVLMTAGAKQVLGVGKTTYATIPELSSDRRRVDSNGILKADVVLVPLEDGDRTEALVKMGKKVIAIDLNPLSRTSAKATITIVDNIVRAMPRLVEYADKLKTSTLSEKESIIDSYNNLENTAQSIELIRDRLTTLAQKGDKQFDL